jgi:hypothetical protein
MSEGVAFHSIVDEEHLKLLSLGYMISAATTGFFSLVGLMYMVMGIVIGTVVSHKSAMGANAGQPPPAFVGWIIGGVGLGLFLFMILLAAAKLRTAQCLKKRKSRTFCMIVAGISCVEVPYGTFLGVLTFVVLGRESVMRLFDASAASLPTN